MTTHSVIADIEIKPVVRVKPEATLAEVAQLLTVFGGVVVVESDPLGEFTDHDCVAAVANGASGETPLCDIPRRAPAFVERACEIHDAAAMMIATGRHALVVMDRGRPLGVVLFPAVTDALWGTTSMLGALRLALHVEDSRP